MAFLTRARTVVLPAAIAAWLAVSPLLAQTTETIEDEVKAAYLFNFTKFVQWPAAAFTGTSDPLNVCASGDAAVLKAVERAIEGERADGRPLRFVSQLPENPSSCHILYVGRGSDERASRLMAAAAPLPVLTVGDAPRFLERGGVIAFVVEHRRVRFDIDLQSADRAGLRVSSKLLRVARHINHRQASQ